MSEMKIGCQSDVSEVHETTAGETANAGRFSGMHMFAIYPMLKEQKDGPGSMMEEENKKNARVSEWMRRSKPGFRIQERALAEGAWTLFRSSQPAVGSGMLSWTRLIVRTPAEMGVDPYTASPKEMAETVKNAAKRYGAGSVGIAPMNEAYVNMTEMGRPIFFEDVEVPESTPEKLVIPKKMKWVVAIAIPMDLDLLEQVPNENSDAAVALGYLKSVIVVSALAEFIRSLGYQAIPCVNDTAQSIPFALDAGLGEMGRTNKLITKDYGAGARLCKVFTDMPMEYDKPIKFGVEEHCKTCHSCADACPTRALSFDDEPSYKTKGPWSNPNHLAWFEDSFKCFQQWQRVGNGCGICMAVCPYTKTHWIGKHAQID
jgi:reductive dehalogenase